MFGTYYVQYHAVPEQCDVYNYNGAYVALCSDTYLWVQRLFKPIQYGGSNCKMLWRLKLRQILHVKFTGSTTLTFFPCA